MSKNKRPEIMAYYFPNWHVDPRNEKWHGEKWTEWNVVKYSIARYPGHQQPKKPLWGFEDEADPEVMAKKIDTAAAYGVNGFIFDWYFYDDGPYRNRCIEEGFLKAANVDKAKFALMWCNHDAVQAHPGSRAFPRAVLCPGNVTAELFRRATQYCIDNYFAHPSYLRLEGKLYFSIYKVDQMVRELGGEAVARELFDDFRFRVEQAGLGQLHLNAVYVGYQWANSVYDQTETDRVDALTSALGLDSRSGHTWFWTQEEFPFIDYGKVAQENVDCYRHFCQDFKLPYNPVFQFGWDSSPRALQSDVYANIGYPFLQIISGATPEQVEKYLRLTKEFLQSDESNGDLLLLHSWNEWTEGTYLEPDEENQFGYLQAILNTFGTSGA